MAFFLCQFSFFFSLNYFNMRYSSVSVLSACLLGVAVASSDVNATCGALASALPGLVYYPDSNPYNASVTSYPFLQLRLEPNCFVRPKTSKDVSIAVNVLRKSGCTDFAVRGGGHNANAGFNNIEDGVTIDMRSINQTEVNDDATIAKIGAGTLSQAVYDAVEPYNVTALAGRIGVVGVGKYNPSVIPLMMQFLIKYPFYRWILDWRRHFIPLSRQRFCLRLNSQLRSRPCYGRNRERQCNIST